MTRETIKKDDGQDTRFGEFPGGSVVRTCLFHHLGLGSIPGRGTKITQATQCGKKQTKNPQKTNTKKDTRFGQEEVMNKGESCFNEK